MIRRSLHSRLLSNRLRRLHEAKHSAYNKRDIRKNPKELSSQCLQYLENNNIIEDFVERGRYDKGIYNISYNVLLEDEKGIDKLQDGIEGFFVTLEDEGVEFDGFDKASGVDERSGFSFTLDGSLINIYLSYKSNVVDYYIKRIIKSGDADFVKAVYKRAKDLGYEITNKKSFDGQYYIYKNDKPLPVKSEKVLFNLLGMRSTKAFTRSANKIGISFDDETIEKEYKQQLSMFTGFDSNAILNRLKNSIIKKVFDDFTVSGKWADATCFYGTGEYWVSGLKDKGGIHYFTITYNGDESFDEVLLSKIERKFKNAQKELGRKFADNSNFTFEYDRKGIVTISMDYYGI